MKWFALDVVPKSFLGIDVGSSSLRIVEISGWADRRSLKNYGELRVRTMYDKPFRTFEKNALLLSTNDIARAIRGILEEIHVTERKAIFALSDFSSFFTTFELPLMKEQELADAVKFEARRHVPIPLSEVVLDWQLIGKQSKKSKMHRILLVAVPKEIITYYEEIARYAGLKLVGLEAEVFGNIRAYLKDDEHPVVLVDAGAQTTTVSIVYKNTLRLSHTIDTGGNSFTERISKALSVDYRKAEEEKMNKGMHIVSGDVRILLPIADLVLTEIRKIIDTFGRQESAEIQKIVLTGGSARLPGLREYMEKQLEKKTEITEPFSNILYPPILEEQLHEMGPSYAVAVGMALRGFE
jgi:type IV pilus assembly protein PilM